MSSRDRESDPDILRDSMRNDDMPPRGWTRGLEVALPQRPQRTDEEAERDAERLRTEADALYQQLRELAPNAPPPTLPDDLEQLEKLCTHLRQQIGVASVPQRHNGWLGHAFVRRAETSPMVCTECTLTLSVARGRCRGRPGRY